MGQGQSAKPARRPTGRGSLPGTGGARMQKINARDVCLQVLPHVPIFEDLDGKQLKAMAKLFTAYAVNPGIRIFSEGQETSSLYIVAAGKVTLSATDVEGQERMLCTRTVHAFFGEQAFVGSGEHAAQAMCTATAMGACTLLVLEQRAFAKNRRASWMAPVVAQLEMTAANWMATHLREIPILAGVPDAKLPTLGGLFTYSVFNEGDVICREGEEGNCFYVISQGRAKVSIVDPHDGHEVQLTVMSAGSYFGEVALVENVPRTATVTALERCVLLALDKQEFGNFISIEPRVYDTLSLMVRQRTANNLRSQRIPFFATFDDHKLDLLAQVCTLHEYEPGRDIITKGSEAPASFHIITHGSVDIVVDGAVVNTLGVGRYFGEISLVAAVPPTATVRTADQRCVCLEISKDDFLTLFTNEPHVLAEIEIRLLQSKVELRHVLKHPRGLELFEQQLEREFSAENIAFYRAAGEFLTRFARPAPDSPAGDEELRAAAQAICDAHIVESADAQVNIKSSVRAGIDACMAPGGAPHAGMFEDAREEIYLLMEKDNFTRFKAGPLFARLLNELHPYSLTRDEAAAVNIPAQVRASLASSASTRAAGALVSSGSVSDGGSSSGGSAASVEEGSASSEGGGSASSEGGGSAAEGAAEGEAKAEEEGEAKAEEEEEEAEPAAKTEAEPRAAEPAEAEAETEE